MTLQTSPKRDGNFWIRAACSATRCERKLCRVSSVAVFYWESGRTSPAGERAERIVELEGASKRVVARELGI